MATHPKSEVVDHGELGQVKTAVIISRDTVCHVQHLADWISGVKETRHFALFSLKNGWSTVNQYGLP